MTLRLTILLLALACSQAGAQDKCLRIGAAGNGSGDDWANAYASLAAAETGAPRGAMVYTAAGDYTGADVTFNTAVSGTTQITFKKATVLEHGQEQRRLGRNLPGDKRNEIHPGLLQQREQLKYQNPCRPVPRHR